MQVGVLGFKDIKEFALLCGKQVEETLPHLTFDLGLTEYNAYYIIQNRHRSKDIEIFIAENDHKRIVGYLVATCQRYFMSDGCYTGQEVIYVNPADRGSRAALMLMQAFHRWSEDIKPKEMFTGVSNGMSVERSTRFFSKLGYENVGVNLRKICK
jgi:L-amino acid N-acyltransferase YncA